MKKLTALLLALCLLCGLAGCDRRLDGRRPDSGSGDASRPEPPRAPGVSEPEEEEPYDAEDAVKTEDLLGFWEGGGYSNAALGLSFALPEGWAYSSDEELLNRMDIVLDSDIVSDRGKMLAELDKNNIIFGMAAQEPNGDSVQIMFERLGNEIAKDQSTEERYAEGVAAQQDLLSESEGNTRNLGETYRAQLGGKDFLVLPIDVITNGTGYKQWMYIRRAGDWMAVVMFMTFSDEGVETMAGGASAFTPYEGGARSGSGASRPSGSPGASGGLTAAGDINRTFSTMFFDFTVVYAYSPAEYHGYTAQSGNKLLVVGVKVKNDFGEALPMYSDDFQIEWGPGDYDYDWAVEAFHENMMPPEWELADGGEVTYDMLFEVPLGQNDFSLTYLEIYVDRFGRDQTGDWYAANFTLLVASAA